MGADEEVDDEDERDRDDDPLPKTQEDRRVAEDPEENVGQDEGDHREGVFALVGVGNVLDQGDPADDEADDGEVGAEADRVAQGVSDHSDVKPGGLDAACDEEEEGQDDLHRGLESSVDQAGQLGEELVVGAHVVVIGDAEDHPQCAVDGWRNRVEEEEDQHFRKLDVPLQSVLHADCHEVDDVQDGRDVVRDKHDQSVVQEPSE